MKAVNNWHFADGECPFCDAHLAVEDPEDFDGATKDMRREEGFWQQCPKCGRDFYLYVTWEPVYAFMPDEP